MIFLKAANRLIIASKKTVMRRFIFILPITLALALVGLSGCLKKDAGPCTDRSVAEDEPDLLSYLITNNITGYTKHSSGLYYKIIASGVGNGPAPTLSSKVYVTYTGRFTNNMLFDSVSDASKTEWVLGGLVEGWKIGLPLIAKGGSIQLFVPSALGYGCRAVKDTNGKIVIPENSNLIFDINLIDVK
jgi:FKBP-type peptidyl-prolyl cis-trans isomerase FkpA